MTKVDFAHVEQIHLFPQCFHLNLSLICNLQTFSKFLPRCFQYHLLQIYYLYEKGLEYPLPSPGSSVGRDGAVNPGVVSSNPGSTNFLSDDCQRQCDMRHSSSINGLSLCGKAASCLVSLLCGVLVRLCVNFYFHFVIL